MAVSTEGERQAELLRAIAHPVRLLILDAISLEEECVCHLSALLDKPQPYISQQLAALKEAGLVADRRAAQRIYYRTVDPSIGDLLRVARRLSGLPERRETVRQPVPGCPCPKCQEASSPSAD